MKNFFSMMGLSYASSKGDGRRTNYSDSRRASYSAVPVDHRRRSSAARRQSYGANRRKSLDPAAVLGRHLFDGRLADPRTRHTYSRNIYNKGKNGGKWGTSLLCSKCRMSHCNECVKFEFNDTSKNDSERSVQPSSSIHH